MNSADAVNNYENYVLDTLAREGSPELWHAEYIHAREDSPLEALCAFGCMQAHVEQNTNPEDGAFRHAVHSAALRLPNLPEAQKSEKYAELLAVLEKLNHPALWRSAYNGARRTSPLEAICAFGRVQAHVAQGAKPMDRDFQNAVWSAALCFRHLPEYEKPSWIAYLFNTLADFGDTRLWSAALDGARNDSDLTARILAKMNSVSPYMLADFMHLAHVRAVIGERPEGQSPLVALQKAQESLKTALNRAYPDGWRYAVIQIEDGVLLLYDSEAGSDDMDDALDEHYLHWKKSQCNGVLVAFHEKSGNMRMVMESADVYNWCEEKSLQDFKDEEPNWREFYRADDEYDSSV